MPVSVEPLYPAGRLERARDAATAAGLDALLISPGAELRYLVGYDAKPLERLTCLVIPVQGDPFLVVPALEQAAADASPAGGLGLEIAPWQETDDPYRLVSDRLPTGLARVGVDDRMWAEKAFTFQAVLPDVQLESAGAVLGALRIRKSVREATALRDAAAAIDRVHTRIGEWLRAGRTEREVARDVALAITAEGHARVDFVIIGSGPNSASPHHEASDRVIRHGDPVVVDIGGTTDEGYCSDSTRVYSIGEPEPEFRHLYDVLLAAQIAQTEAVRPGITAEELDAIGRDLIAEAGYGEYFIHRTGHGIGLESHEPPYIAAGSPLPLEPGMAFSIEPGIYLPDRHGARIEDIVVCTPSGGERLNRTPRELVVLP
jgi:Xaa-Pro aminopeptidase